MDQPAQNQQAVSGQVPSQNIGQVNPPLGGQVVENNQGVAEILLSQGAISQSQYNDVKVESVNTGKMVEDIIEEKGLVAEEILGQAKATYYNVGFMDLAETGGSPEALALVPESVAQRYRLFPFAIDKRNNTLSVAMGNPLDLKAIEFVEKKSGKRVIPYLTTKSDLESALVQRYAQSLSTEVTQALDEAGMAEQRTVDITKLGEVIREAPLAKIVETLLTFAVKSRASDIHIEPEEFKTRVRYRIDGILREKLMLPRGVHDGVVSRTKVLGGMKIDEKRLPQDGRFSFKIGDAEIDLRVSSMPTAHGEKIVMRLLKKTQNVPDLPELGLRGRALKNLEEAVRVPYGIILITGPTGSGKTTTLYSILSKISTPKVNIITLEDPIEYEISGVNQVQVNPQAGLTFASGLRSFLRQDPDIIMVGEVRDEETTELAVQAALTGHLVFSTLHTNSAAGALPRLLDMKAEPFLLVSSMTCVVAQRVVRRVCEHCKEEYTPLPEMVEDIKEVLGTLYDAWMKQQGKNQLSLYRGRKCAECNETGFFGRIGIFEVLPVREKISRLILERAPATTIEKEGVSDGMILMKQDGYMKALEGVTTIEEVLRVAEIQSREDVLGEEIEEKVGDGEEKKEAEAKEG